MNTQLKKAFLFVITVVLIGLAAVIQFGRDVLKVARELPRIDADEVKSVSWENLKEGMHYALFVDRDRF